MTCLASADRLEEARRVHANLLRRVPDYQFGHFLAAFRLAPDVADLYRKSAARIGFV